MVMGSVDNLAKTDQRVQDGARSKLVGNKPLIISTSAAPLAADIFHSLTLYLLSNTVSNLRHDCREKDIF